MRVFCDGACLGNPGPGAWAFVLRLGHEVIEKVGEDSETTNNRMELTAVLEALKLLEARGVQKEEIEVCCDSQYVLRGMESWRHSWGRRGWKTSEGEDVKNQDLWMLLHEIEGRLSKSNRFKWVHVAGHAGVPGNERVDEMANSAASGSEVILYEGPLSAYSFNLDILEGNPRLIEKKKSKRKSSSGGYYLSYVGGTIYRDQTWAQCSARVQGVSGAKYKKVSTAEEEAEVLKSWGQA